MATNLLPSINFSSQQTAPSAQLKSGALPPITQGVLDTIGSLGNAAAAPVRDIGAYTRIQMDPKAKAKLDAINNNSKLSLEDKITQGQKIMQQYGGQTQQQQQSAQQGSEGFFGGASIAPALDTMGQVAGPIVSSSLKALPGQIKNVVSETMDNAAAQPGGLEAGFAKIPSEDSQFLGSSEGTNTWSQLIRDPKSGEMVNNPNFKPGSEDPTMYSQDTTAADQETANPGQPNTQNTPEQPGWPEKPTDTTVAPKKPFKLPGTFDPIDETQASNASQNSKAYSVTTPDIQAAYRRNGITDPSQVYPVKQALYDNIINPTLESDTTKLPLGEVGNPKADGIIPKIVKEMQRMDPTLSDLDAQNAAAPMLNKINGLAQSESGGAVQPNTIGLKNILDYKTLLNQSNAVKNLMNGQLPATLPDISTVATRNVLAGLVSDYAPSGISQAVKDYGLLEEGFPSYLKAATTERAPFSLTNAVLGKDLGKFLPPIVGAPINLAARGAIAAAGNPLGRLAMVGTGGLALGLALPEIKNVYDQLTNKNYSSADDGGQPSDTGVHNTSIPPAVNATINPTYKSATDLPTDMSTLTPDKNGNYGVPDVWNLKGSDGGVVVIKPGDAATLNQQLENLKLKGGSLPGGTYETKAYWNTDYGQKQITAAENIIKSKVDLGNSIDPTQYQQLEQKAEDARAILKTAPLNLLNTNSDYNKLASAFNGKYRRLADDLKALEAYSGAGTLFTPQTNDAAMQSLDQVNKQFLGDLYTKFRNTLPNNTTGTNVNQFLNSGTSTGTPTGNSPLPPVTGAPASNDFSGMVGGSNPGLPSGWTMPPIQ